MKKNTLRLDQLEITLKQSITSTPEKMARFFKTTKDSYAQHDQFLGINNPILRMIAKQYHDISLDEIQTLLQAAYNEKRLLGLFILVIQYKKADQKLKQKLYDFYLKNLNTVNNWNLVDSSAHLIIGAHLLNQDKQILVDLATSENLWHRRIAIVATWWFIRKQDLEWTLLIASKLLHDKQDLIHKAVGWMLREAGKKNNSELILFLEKHCTTMPRTMLRYAIEKLTIKQKQYYLQKKQLN